MIQKSPKNDHFGTLSHRDYKINYIFEVILLLERYGKMV